MENAVAKTELMEEALTPDELAVILELRKNKSDRKPDLEYESFEGYELPPRTQFSMLKKPAVSIRLGKMKFNMACIKTFLGTQHVITVVNAKKKRLAVIPCAEEESASVEWARCKADGQWVNKDITSVDFVENLYGLMGWDRNCRYKVLARIANSDRGLIFVFDLEEAIMFAAHEEIEINPKTGKPRKRVSKYYPDIYKNRIGRYYNDYEQGRQLDLFENTEMYDDGIN